MTDTIDLAIARVRKNVDCTDVKPGDLLAKAKHDIENGDFVNPKRIMITVIDEHPDGSMEIFSYRAGMSRAEEVAYLEMAKHGRIGDWVK